MKLMKAVEARPGRVALALATASLAVWSCTNAPVVAPGASETKTTANVKPGVSAPTATTPGANTPAANAPAGNNPSVITRSPIINDAAMVAAFPQGPEGSVSGKLLDQYGNPAAGATVSTSLETVTADASGNYKVRVPSGADVHVRFGTGEDGFVFFDHHMTVMPQAELTFDNEVLALDKQVTSIPSGKAGVATSSDLSKVLQETSTQRRQFSAGYGLLQSQSDIEKDLEAKGLKAVYLTIPDGAIIGDAKVRLSWLNPMPRSGKPYGDLYGPLETYTDWDATKKTGVPQQKVVPLGPVNFADIQLGKDASLAPGATVTVKWVVGPEVLKTYPIQMVDGKAFFPCYTYNEKTQVWDIPVLATVFEENGYTWAEYSMRGSEPPKVDPPASGT